MMTQPLLDTLRHLKLTGMHDALAHQLTQPDTYDLPFEDRLGMLLDREVLHRDNRRLDRLLKAAKLRVTACVEDIDYRHPRGLERGRMAPLTSGEWIGQSLNLCITGPTGCGKTWLACALGNQACRQGYSVRYLRVPRLFEQLRIAQGDGSYARLMGQLQKTDLLILDDWGMQKMTAPQRQDLMEVIEDRHGRGSTLIASQLPIEHWHDYIGAATVADAILDRLLHSGHRLTRRGESMRKNAAPKAATVDPSWPVSLQNQSQRERGEQIGHVRRNTQRA